MKRLPHACRVIVLFSVAILTLSCVIVSVHADVAASSRASASSSRASSPSSSSSSSLSCPVLKAKCTHGLIDEDCTSCACFGGWAGQLCDVCNLRCLDKKRPNEDCTRCECPPGWRDSLAKEEGVEDFEDYDSDDNMKSKNTGGGVCVDVDECAVNNGGCSPLVRCRNLPGSFVCDACPPYYIGNGYIKCFETKFVVAVLLCLVLMVIVLRYLHLSNPAVPRSSSAAGAAGAAGGAGASADGSGLPASSPVAGRSSSRTAGGAAAGGATPYLSRSISTPATSSGASIKNKYV